MNIDLALIKQRISDSPKPGPPRDGSFQQTTVFLLLFDSLDPRVLAIQKSDNEGYPWRNQVALPGGHVDESDPTALEAAYRELKEEVNIDRSQVDYFGSIGHFQTINHRDIQVFVGWWKEQSKIRFDSLEISRVLKIPIRKLADIHIKKQYQGRIPDVKELVYPYRDVVVWGVTARILHHFIEILDPGTFDGQDYVK